MTHFLPPMNGTARLAPAFLAAAVFFLLFFPPPAAQALCDEVYLEYRQKSPAFDQAEKALSVIWRRLNEALPEKEMEALKQNQRAWLNLARDREAGLIAEKRGLSLPDAYAEATMKRVAELKDLLEKRDAPGPAGRYGSGMGFLTVHDLPGNLIRFDIETDWPPQRCSGRLEGAQAPLQGNVAVYSDPECPGLKLEFTDNAVVVTEDGHCGHHGLNCNFEGRYERVR